MDRFEKALCVIARFAVAATAAGGCAALPARAEPVVEHTEVLGPFTGHDAKLHPDNVAPVHIRYYGTDLGWSYAHQGRLVFLFGDTSATEAGEPIAASKNAGRDDMYGSIDLKQWSDPTQFAPGRVPPLLIGQEAGSAEVAAIDPGYPMESFKTPLGGFSNGHDEYGVFYQSKPQGCRVDSDCGGGLTCDTGLGYVGTAWDDEKGLTLGCVDGTPACTAATMHDREGRPIEDSGFCVDTSSSAWADTDVGRVSGIAVHNLIGVRSTEDPRRYSHVRRWLTTKFSNPAIRTVQRFDPSAGVDATHRDYSDANGTGDARRVFFWGRSGFVGVGARHRSLAMYFAYVDMPVGPDFAWQVQYFTGTDAQGRPQFSPDEHRAVGVDLDSTRAGVQTEEKWDIVDQVSVAWVEPLDKWVMLYGGGMVTLPTKELPRCGVLELFARAECTEVVAGKGAIHVRTADQPWGPWTPPQDVLVGGDPAVSPPEQQYAPGGIMRHPDCKGPACVGHTNFQGINPHEYGFLYGANIISEWTRPAPGGGADLIWNVSTWDPYRVVLVRTRIRP